MTTARDDRRPDRRPEWLRRQHGHASPRPRTELDRWADKIGKILDGAIRQSIADSCRRPPPAGENNRPVSCHKMLAIQ
jgi:hypothetical protein